jgi:NAD+ kinase
VAVVSKVGSKDSEQSAKDVTKKLLAKKSTVYTISPIQVEGAKQIETLEELKKEKLDLVITLGGDGTTLRVFRNLENETPILTINVGGNRGILAEITIEEIDDAIEQILKDNFFLDKRTRVVASCGGKEFPPALNEIYISRTMDGVIIATPSGSTGHSFSLGGPILHESLDVLIITPVAPVYRLASLIVPDEKIEITCSHDCNIAMDAQVVKAVGYEEPITIKKYKIPAVFLRLKKRGLRQMSKLGF